MKGCPGCWLSWEQLQKQKLEKQKKAADLCPFSAERFGTWDVRPPETPKTCYGGSMFYARRESFKTNPDKAPDEPKNLPFPIFQAGNAPVLQDPIKSRSYQKVALTSGKLRAMCLLAASDIYNFCSRNLGRDSSRILINIHYTDKHFRLRQMESLPGLPTTSSDPARPRSPAKLFRLSINAAITARYANQQKLQLRFSLIQATANARS